MTIFMDALDNPINVGDQLVHAFAYNSSASLRRCIVIGFTPQMMRVQPLDFKREFRRLSNPPKYGRQGEYVIKEPREPVKQAIIKPGNTVLRVNNEEWPEVEQMRMMGILL